MVLSGLNKTRFVHANRIWIVATSKAYTCNDSLNRNHGTLFMDSVYYNKRRTYYPLSDDEESGPFPSSRLSSYSTPPPLGMELRLLLTDDNEAKPTPHSAAAAAIALALSYEENEECYIPEEDSEKEIHLTKTNRMTPIWLDLEQQGWNGVAAVANSTTTSRSSFSSSSSSSSRDESSSIFTASKTVSSSMKTTAATSNTDFAPSDVAALPLLHDTAFEHPNCLATKDYYGSMLDSILGLDDENTVPQALEISFDSVWNEDDGFDFETVSPFSTATKPVFEHVGEEHERKCNIFWFRGVQRDYKDSEGVGFVASNDITTGIFSIDFGDVEELEDFTNDNCTINRIHEKKNDDDDWLSHKSSNSSSTSTEGYFSTFEIPFGSGNGNDNDDEDVHNGIADHKSDDDENDDAETAIGVVFNGDSHQIQSLYTIIEDKDPTAPSKQHGRDSKKGPLSPKRNGRREAKWCLRVVIAASIVVCCILIAFAVLYSIAT